MPAVTREFTITYGTLVVGGTTDRVLDEKYRIITKNYNELILEYAFMIQKDLEADFAIEIAAIESAFRTPRQDLKIELGSAILLDLKRSDSSGFNHDPEIIKRGEIADGGRTRRYEVRVTVELPADLSGQAGRRDSIVEVEFTESRRRLLRITGTYTAISGTSAEATYLANIDTYTGAIITALTGTFQRRTRLYSHDDDNVNVDFEEVHEEILFNEATGVLDDPAIINQILFIRRNKVAPGDSGFREAAIRGQIVRPPAGSIFGGGIFDTRRPVSMTIEYEASIDSSVTTNLVSKWESTIRPFVLSQIKNVLGTSTGALVEEEPDFDGHENRIRATMEFLGIESAAARLEFQLTTERRDETGNVLVPVWDGNPLSKYLFQGPARRIFTITERLRALAGFAGGGGAGGRFVGAVGAGLRFGIGVGGGGVQFQGGFGGAGPGRLVSRVIGAFAALANVNVKIKGAGGGAVPARKVPNAGPNRVLITEREEVTPLRMGIGNDFIDVEDRVRVIIFEDRVQPGGGGGGGLTLVVGGS